MFALRGSLDGIGFPALRQLLGSIEQSGCLYIWLGQYTARVYFASGQVVAAALDVEDDQASGVDPRSTVKREFAFAEGEAPDEAIDLPSTLEVLDYLGQLGEQPEEVSSTMPILSAVPYHAEPSSETDASEPVQIHRRTLRVLTAVDGRRTIAELADGHELAQTLRDLARLLDLGFIGVALPTTQPAPRVSALSRLAPTRTAAPARNGLSRTVPQQREVLVRPEVRCPMVGFVDDAAHSANGPSLLHRCFASGAAQELSSNHQAEYCFSAKFSACPRLRAPASLPAPAPSLPEAYEPPPVVRPSGVRRLLGVLGLSTLASDPHS
jgi:hypothetical protein